jgi:hypothetical protein
MHAHNKLRWRIKTREGYRKRREYTAKLSRELSENNDGSACEVDRNEGGQCVVERTPSTRTGLIDHY